MSSLSGRTCLVTGANSGIGKEVARGLAARGATVLLLCRDRARGRAAHRDLEAETGSTALALIVCDLADPDAVRAAADVVRREHDRLDVLVNNAGLARARRTLTDAGVELTFAVNHLGHFGLTNLLLDVLSRAAGRVVTVSSGAHHDARLGRAPLEAIARGEAWRNGFQAYADSKLANVLFTFELARRASGTGITANAVHPGMVATRIWNRNYDPISLLARLAKPFMASPARGAAPVLRLATDPALDDVTGRYFARESEAEAADAAYDRGLAARLWRLSEELTGVHGPGPAA